MADAAERFFGRRLQIDDRVFRSLGVVTRKTTRAPLSWHVWWSIYLTTPGVAETYEMLGNGGPMPSDLNWLDPASDYASGLQWDRTFRHLFSVRGPDGDELVPAGHEVKLHGKLSVIDLAVGLLQSGAIERKKRGDRRLTNLVIRRMMTPDGVSTSKARLWDEQAESVTANATRLLRQILAADPSFGSQQFILFFEGPRLRLRPFGTFGAHVEPERPLDEGSLWIARSNALEPIDSFGKDALAQLEALIEREAPERAFQSYFEEYPELLTTLGPWKHAHAQLVLHRDAGGPLIPDMFLERLDSDFCDVLDLKLPTAQLVRRQHNRVRFRDCVMEAVAQIREYRDWFETPSNRHAFRDRYGLDAYRPLAAVIIGRRASYYDEVERIRLESGLPDWVRLRTYDDVLAGITRWRKRGVPSPIPRATN